MDACWDSLFFMFVLSEQWMCDSSTKENGLVKQSKTDYGYSQTKNEYKPTKP
jgi:hypothetical protein